MLKKYSMIIIIIIAITMISTAYGLPEILNIFNSKYDTSKTRLDFDYSKTNLKEISDYLKIRSSDIDVITNSDYVISNINNFTPVVNKTTRIYSNGSSVLLTNNKYDEYMPNMTVKPSSGSIDISITAYDETGGLIRFDESSPNSNVRVSYEIGDRIPNKLYSVKIYWVNGTKYQEFNSLANNTGFIKYDSTGFSDSRYEEITLTTSPPDTTPSVILAISSSSITSGGASISWTTNEPSDTQVEYGSTTSYGSSSALDANLVTSHSQVLSGLTASTLYHYRVKSRDAVGNLVISSDQTFTTSASDSSLKGYWKFDENTGTTAADSSGNNNNGIMSNGMISGPAHASGKIGNALSFDGANDYVDAGNQESLNIVDAITIEAWVNPNLITGISRVIAKKSSVYYFQINRNGGLEIYFYGTANPGYHQTTSTIPLNTWTHVAVTYNGSMVLLYKNGISQSFDDTGNLVSNSDSVFIGSESGVDRQFDGLIDEVKIYNRALSASEIFADYNAGSSDTTQPTISAISTSSINSGGATITWTTNEPSDSHVVYGTTSYGSSTTLNTNLVISHSQRLSGLTASTLYHYRVKSRDTAGNFAISADQTFNTSSPDTTPPVISGISSSSVTSDGASFSWTTNEPSDTQVDYGTTISYGSSTTLDTNLVISHSQGLSGLTASTLYHYRVKSRDTAGNLTISTDQTFTTSPPDTTPPVISAISSSGLTSGGASISWTTNEPSNIQVE